MELKEKAVQLLKNFKRDNYIFGIGKLEEVGQIANQYGKSILVISNTVHLKSIVDKVIDSLDKYGIELAGGRVVPGAKPNSPREDVYRMESYILHFKPDCIIVIGGGSTIDAGKQLLPIIAIQTVASSGAHLTKYSNVTDPAVGQKKLIIDKAIIPTKSIFDYAVTKTIPLNLTIDGAFDGIAHSLEVFYGINDENYELVKDIAATGIELIVKYTPKVIKNLHNREAREALGLATDLGAYSIMVGGTNGGHLTSFSLVDVTSHGRACGIMNIYYSVFFAPAIKKQLKVVGDIFKKYGYIKENLEQLRGRKLGVIVAKGMIKFARAINFPIKLSELEGFSDKYIEKALTAAKNPQLDMKLKNMPICQYLLMLL